jgi:MATE family multidrug resistance protein
MPAIFSKNYFENYKLTFLLAYPVILSQLGHIMVGVVDTAMVGKIGTLEQAAVALSNGLYMIVLVFGLGISYGVTPLVAEADSAKKDDENRALLKHSIVINTLIGILLFLLLLMISPILNLFNQQKEVVVLAIPFLNVMMLSMIPLCIFSGLKQFIEGLSYTRMAMVITIGASFLNILLNYLMIFGHWGLPAMGIMGACWASFIARVAMAIAMLLYVYYNKAFKIYWQNIDFRTYSKTIIKKILVIGVPSGLQWVFEIGVFSVAVILIGWIGPKAQAAHLITLSLAAITYMMASGLAAATTVRVGNQLGMKSEVGIRTAAFSSLIMVILFMGIMAISFISLRFYLPSLFTNDLEVINLSASLLVIAAFFQLSDGVQVVALGALRGVKDVKIPTLITFVAYWIIGLPMSYVFAFIFNLGALGVWYGLFLGLTSAAILLFLRFKYVSYI